MEVGSGWGTHVYLWRIHFDIWQNQYNSVKFKNKKREKFVILTACKGKGVPGHGGPKRVIQETERMGGKRGQEPFSWFPQEAMGRTG